MHYTRKINTLKRISIIPFFFACIPIAFIYLFLRDIAMLNSLFIDYVNSGTSVFFPFLPSDIIAFQFTTGHLIDIIIIVNIISFIERGGYQYYMKVCEKKNYSDIYAEAFFFETNGTQEESYQNSDLLLTSNVDSATLVNERSDEFNFYQKSRLKANHFSRKSGYYSTKFRMQHYDLNYLRNSRKKNTHKKNVHIIFQKFSANNFKNYPLPSKNNNIFSNFSENFHQEEGR
jgi:Tfp pilus assembly protein PilE